ncbi:MAG: hypothetical protein GEU75_10365 [Dehalococcoidia bacterium]|nr:hypothetical protein [Dehalococcoidia bacterium]
MKLFFDEDLGKGVAVALYAVGVDADYVGPSRRIKKGTLDHDWLPIVGEEGWLVISANKAILQNDVQRDLWIANNVGGVFLTTGRIRSVNLLALILRKLTWLERLAATERRPFAYMLSPAGQTRRAAEIPLLPELGHQGTLSFPV